MQRCSPHLALNKMQANTMLKVHLIHQNSYHQERKYWQGYENKGTYMHSWWEGELVWPWNSELLQNSKMKAVYSAGMPQPYVCPYESKLTYNRDLHPHGNLRSSQHSWAVEPTLMSSNGWLFTETLLCNVWKHHLSIKCCWPITLGRKQGGRNSGTERTSGIKSGMGDSPQTEER